MADAAHITALLDLDRQPPMNTDILITELLRDEGLRLLPYVDTRGCVTIGVGRNLTVNGISHDEALIFLHRDIETVTTALTAQFSWYPTLDPVRQRVLVNMGFNLGMRGLKQFVSMLTAVADARYQDAATAMLASNWAHQVGERAIRLSQMMSTGIALA